MTPRDGRSQLRWLMIDGEPDAHCITNDDPSGRGWRPLCQQSDLASAVLTRDARDGLDSFCTTCRQILVARIRMAQARHRPATDVASHQAAS